MIMEKKLYISPNLEILNLRAMNAMMDEPLFGPSSTPNDPFATTPSGAPERKPAF